MTDSSGASRPTELTCDEVRELAGAFVLDALDEDEAAVVRAHLATCPDVHAEVLDLAAAVPVLAEAVPQVEPSAALRSRILAAAAADLDPAATTPASFRPAAPAPVAPVAASPIPAAAPAAAAAEPVDLAGRRRRPVLTWVAGIAAVLAITLLGGRTVMLQNELDAALAYQQSVAAVTEVAGQPGSLTAVLAAEGGGPTGLAAVDASGQVTLAMQDLAATSGDQVYEAWVIAADGVPVPLGSFQVAGDGTGTFTATGLPTEPGIVLALTLEPGPGATTPTLPLVASGTAT